MSGKQAKRERRLEREAAREAARRQERQRTIVTLIVIGIIVVLGGIVIWLSVGDGEDIAAEPTPTPTDAASPTPTTDDRPVACGAEAPTNAGLGKQTFSEPPPTVLEEGKDYRAIVETSCGTVVIDLAEEGAPQTVNNFVFLAQQGFFDGLEIFRNATTIGALQTGSGTDDASFQLGYTIPDELDLAKEEGYPPGTVAMANAGPDTGGSQFFFVYNDLFTLEPNYARFGFVVEGLDVLETIGAIAADGERPTERTYINSVTVEIDGAAAEGADPAVSPEPTEVLS